MDHLSETEELSALIDAVPEGWSRVQIAGDAWAITRTTRAGGRVVSFDAERLSGGEQLGANVWLTEGGAQLRPCEVPAEDVMRVLRAAVSAVADAAARPAASDA